jgi:hypothetical protein
MEAISGMVFHGLEKRLLDTILVERHVLILSEYFCPQQFL